MPVTRVDSESDQPRKQEAQEDNARVVPNCRQNRSSGYASKVQEEDRNQDIERSNLSLSEDGERARVSPEMIHYNLEPGVDSGTIDFGHSGVGDDVTYVTTTTTKVEEHKVHQTEDSGTARSTTAQPQSFASTTSSKTFSGQRRYDVQSSVQGGVRRKTTFFQEGRFPLVAEAGQPPVTLSSTTTVESRRVMVPPNSSLEQLLQVQRLHRQERDRILEFMTAEYESYKCFSEEQFEVFRTENARLLRELSASASRVSLLEIRLNSRSDGLPETASQHDKMDSTITTTITTITTTVTIVTERIEQYRQVVARNKGQISISKKDLEHLLSDLSDVSSQMTVLQQDYARVSSDFSSVRYQLQVTLSLRDEKDGTIATLTAEVAQWKNADAAKAQQIIAIRRDNDMLRRDVSASSSLLAELRERQGEQSRELEFMRKELRTNASLIETRDRKIASFTAEVAHWRQSDIAKAEQISTVRQDYEMLQRDHSAFSSRIAELQRRFDAQSIELGSVRNELQANKSLVAEKDRTITTLTTEVEQWERADATRTERSAAEHRDKEQVQRDLATFSSQTDDLRRRYDAQSHDIVFLRNELQIKTSPLEEKEHITTSLAADVSQMRHEDSGKTEQVATARRDPEQLRGEPSGRCTELREHHVTQSQEFESVGDEQIEFLHSAASGQRTRKPFKASIRQFVRAMGGKNKQLEEFRRDLPVATSRNSAQNSYEALSKEMSAVQGELKAKESTITSLTAQIEQLKHSDTMKTRQISDTLKQVERVQANLSASTSQLAELQSRYRVQSRDLIAVRNDLQTVTSSCDSKDRAIALLTTEVDQWKRADASKTEEIATSLRKVEELQQNLSTSASNLAELHGRYEAQTRELRSLHDELQRKTSLHEGNDRTIASLIAEVEQWKHADAYKAEQIATTIKRVEELQRELSASTSQLAELRGHHEAQSHELQTMTSSNEDKDRTIATLTADIEERKRTDVVKEERIATALKKTEVLQQELATTTSQIAHLRQRYELQSKELGSLRDQFQGDVLDKDDYISSLTSQLEEWERLDATKGEELAITRKDLAQLRRELAASSSQIENWKRLDAAKTMDLAVTQKELEQLRRDLSVASTQIAEHQQRYETQSTNLRSLREQLEGDKNHAVATLNAEIEQWRRADTAKAEELGQLRRELETVRASASILEATDAYIRTMAEGVKDHTVDSSLCTDANRAEELALELAKRNEENEELQEILARYQEQLADRQSQLDGVQRFVSTADKYMDTTIIQQLLKLNTEVQYNAMIIAESTLEDFQARATKERTSAAQRVSESIGQTLACCLGKKECDDVAWYLPIAFQAYLTYHLRSTISSWTIKKGYNEFIDEIYERLQKSEAQTVSGRWRSLTRAYISPTCISDPDALTSSIVAGLSDVVVAAGCATSISAARSNISTKFGNKVSSIVSIAGQFSRMIGEVVSADFEVFSVLPTQIFEDTTMEQDTDGYDEPISSERMGGRVLCSTNLGMTKRIQMASGNKNTLTVVKTKVVLEEFV